MLLKDGGSGEWLLAGCGQRATGRSYYVVACRSGVAGDFWSPGHWKVATRRYLDARRMDNMDVRT